MTSANEKEIALRLKRSITPEQLVDLKTCYQCRALGDEPCIDLDTGEPRSIRHYSRLLTATLDFRNPRP